jgi:hypothetical protein
VNLFNALRGMSAVSDRLNDELDCLEDEITQLQADCIDSSAQRRYDTRGRAASSSCTPLVSSPPLGYLRTLLVA